MNRTIVALGGGQPYQRTTLFSILNIEGKARFGFSEEKIHLRGWVQFQYFKPNFGFNFIPVDTPELLVTV